MKWNQALQQIGAALKEGKTVEIVYHRKYNTKISLLDKVDCINEYMWHGVPEYAVSTWCDQIAEYSHIIDEVRVQEGE